VRDLPSFYSFVLSYPVTVDNYMKEGIRQHPSLLEHTGSLEEMYLVHLGCSGLE
jgi:hypothetical protein